MRVGGDAHGVPQRDQAVLVEVEEALVEGLHAVVLALGDDLLDGLGALRVDDALEDAAGHHHHFRRRHAARPVSPLE